MKYEYTVMIEKERNTAPEYQVQERLKEEFADWEVVSARTDAGSPFKGTDGLSHVYYTTTVVLRRLKIETKHTTAALTAECKA